jgi:methylated-DNA-protein-cysteine methyltransferase-like protein
VTPEEYREAVLDLIPRIPEGRVMSYGSIAEYFSESSGRTSARLIGNILAHCTRTVPWHRVVQGNGSPARGHEAEALRRLAEERTPLRNGRVDMRRAAWSPEAPPHGARTHRDRGGRDE